MVNLFKKKARGQLRERDKKAKNPAITTIGPRTSEPTLLRHTTTDTDHVEDSSVDYGSATMKGRPILFHRVHSENVQLLGDQRRAKRIESFCKGICFSDRPINICERVYMKFAEVSTSWSGVVRVGFTSHDPTTVNPPELPRYACPDLTYKPGYWAKALPERYAEQGTVLFYYLTRSGDVMFGINGEEKGVFFSSVATNCNLWALVDIYGNTTCMEFVDGWQLNNLGTNSALSSGGSMTQHSDLDHSFQQSLSIMQPTSSPQPLPGLNTSNLPALTATQTTTSTTPSLVSSLGSMSLPPVRYHVDADFSPMPFHHTMGRNVCLSSDRMIAVRLVEEYCNGYVFTNRPLLCGEKLVIQVLSLEKEYTGGLAFGMTSCDPITISPEELPDDSDLLLDRREYWVVNKDVCTTPDIGDELSFHLTTEGEVRYGKNGHYIATLMYIDKTLPMWALLDVYGNTQKIHSLGVTGTSGRAGSGSGLTVALPPPRTSSQSSLPTTPSTTVVSQPGPPPRPPPPRASPSGSLGRGGSPSGRAESQVTTTPPSLPPKQFRGGPQASPVHPAALMQSPRAMGSPLPPPLMPTPLRPPPTLPERQNVRPTVSPARAQQPQVRGAKPTPQPPVSTTPKTSPTSPLAKQPPARHQPPTPTPSMDEHDETYDNESNECKVCMNNAVDCALYMCGHMCLCYECAQDIKNKHNTCPICRQEIRDIIRIFRS